MLLTPAVRVRIYTSLSRRDELIIALVRQEEIIHSKHGMAWHGMAWQRREIGKHNVVLGLTDML
jgi:hypothetical protein